MSMKKGQIKVFLVIALIVVGLTVIGGISNKVMKTTRLSAKERAANTTIELYVIAPCESCHEEDKFRREISNQLTLAGYESNKITVNNVYKESGATHFSDTVDKYQLDITMMDLPAAIVDGVVYQGTYQEIGRALVSHFENGAKNEGKSLVPGNHADDSASSSNDQAADSEFYRAVLDVGKDDTALVLFVTSACDSCHDAQTFLEEILTDRSKLYVYNILDDGNITLYQSLVRLYGVPEAKQKVPILFTKADYLPGDEAIINGAEEAIENVEARGPWDKKVQGLSTKKENHSISKLQLILTGLINGLNPCGISMLLMVLSVLLVSDCNFFGGSFIFILGKFLTYLLLGFMIETFIGAIESTTFGAVQRVLKIAFALLAFAFGTFYLIDFIHVVKKDYGKVRLQLPERLRRWNHEMIGKLTNIPVRLWYPVLFLLGIVISAGEFLCTGQIYLAELLYMARHNPGIGPELTLNLTLYLAAMCIPMILLVLLVSRGKTVMSASHLSVKALPAIKLIYSIFFFALFITLFF
ncbi:cytochrome c biogenesis CcdA family protein [Butyrivibrio sp. VCD2006]|uniref:cytochrome c biogenesis CcdA family protein n=1 Tax=Butyrivibrio sp. VCD2006 TaxID=1280664 RepID=UPI0003FFA18F|nr:hypothetical protein [Butyrivibrio sp. VCD2006]